MRNKTLWKKANLGIATLKIIVKNRVQNDKILRFLIRNKNPNPPIKSDLKKLGVKSSKKIKYHS